MPVIKKEGKDTIIFATKEDHDTPSKLKLPEQEPSPGIILPNGEINWNCPCLGGMTTGPCGVEFREAFSCFHYSKSENKGSECFEVFKTMQNCMVKYPSLYNKESDMEELEKQEEKEQTELLQNKNNDLESNDKVTEIESSPDKSSVTNSKTEVVKA